MCVRIAVEAASESPAALWTALIAAGHIVAEESILKT